MSQKIITLMNTIPLGGGYTWDKTKNADGVTKDLIYKGQVIRKKDTASYCTGATFQLWFEAIGQYLNISVSEMRALSADWYVATGKRKGPVDALVSRGLGVQVQKAQPGDLAQIWRKSGSGHSVAPIEHTLEYLEYWSTQESTDGYGYRKEFFRNVKNPITEIYIVRPK